MIQPGAKNWIEKYFSLVEEGAIDLKSAQRPSDVSEANYLHNMFFDSGITFGYPISFLFFEDEKEEVISHWTHDEKTVFLLFECLLMVYISENATWTKEDFIETLLEFYTQYKDQHSINVLKYFFKETSQIKLENILKDRTHVKRTLTNQFWVSYFSNSVIYIDVLAFRTFLGFGKELQESYDKFIQGALQTAAAMSIADGQIVDIEQQILSVYLNASNMKGAEKKEFSQRLENKEFSIYDIKVPKHAARLYKLYLLDLAVLTIYSDVSVMDEEVECLFQLCKHLGIDEEQLEHSKVIINRFVIKNNDKIPFLKGSSSYEKLYGNFSKRWIKILGRSKDKFVTELKENKELIELVNKSFKQGLTDEEKDKVKNQFKDLVKSVPAVAIFMLPGGAILLPIILKIIPDLIPSAFRNNEMK